MLRSDVNVHTITPRDLVTNTEIVRVLDGDLGKVERAGLSKERWYRYQKLFRDLGLRGGVLRGELGCVCFKAEPESLFNGDRSKGYCYSEHEPTGAIVSDLSVYRPPGDAFGHRSSYIAYKLIKPHWYLYFARG